jgi:SPP1 gp7 family putative phage head morphogenesis protein
MGWLQTIEAIARRLHSGEIKPVDLSDDLINEYANRIFQGASKGLNSQGKIGQPDEQTLFNIKANTWAFSGAKTHAELKDWSARLIGSDGNVKPFSEFFAEIRTINKTYREHYLRAEYDLALKTGQSIAQYNSLMADRQTHPYWRISVVLDERTRAAHAALNGITLRWDDPFWKTHWPPFAWNCRCTIQAVSENEAEPTDLSQIKLPPIDRQFMRNPAVDGIIFHSSHPVFGAVIKKEAPRVLQSSIYAMDREDQFFAVKKYNNGGVIKQHILTNTKKEDYPGVLKVAQDYARKGIEVEILPTKIHQDDIEARQKLMPEYDRLAKTPDLRINQTFYLEVEQPKVPLKRRAIKDRAKHGLQQADKVVVLLDEEFNTSTLSDILGESLQNQQVVFRLKSGKYYPKWHEPK